MTAALRTYTSRRQTGFAELGAVIVLYAAYELLRGVGDASLAVARDHAGDIVELELALGVFVERAVQDWAAEIPVLPALLGLAYVTLHLGATGLALFWLHRSHPTRFPLVRNVLVLSTALSLVGYVLYPAAPPRLAGQGFVDTVSSHTHVNLSSDLLGSLYNPFAAVPSMHFGYALIVGFAARRVRTAPRCSRRSARCTRRSCSSTSSRPGTTSCSTRRWAGSSSSPLGSPPARSSPLPRVRVAAPRDARQRDVASRLRSSSLSSTAPTPRQRSQQCPP